jgi:hypothetical protein
MSHPRRITRDRLRIERRQREERLFAEVERKRVADELARYQANPRKPRRSQRMKRTTIEPPKPRGRTLQTSRIESVGSEAGPAREHVLVSAPFHALHDRPPTIGSIQGKESKP